jgi:hypothetical protein
VDGAFERPEAVHEWRDPRRRGVLGVLHGDWTLACRSHSFKRAGG